MVNSEGHKGRKEEGAGTSFAFFSLHALDPDLVPHRTNLRFSVVMSAPSRPAPDHFILHPSSFILPFAPAPINALREESIARIKTRLKRIPASKNAGRCLFELADYVACLSVTDSRN